MSYATSAAHDARAGAPGWIFTGDKIAGATLDTDWRVEDHSLSHL